MFVCGKGISTMFGMDESFVTEGTHFTCPGNGYHGLDVPEMVMGGRGESKDTAYLRSQIAGCDG